MGRTNKDLQPPLCISCQLLVSLQAPGSALPTLQLFARRGFVSRGCNAAFTHMLHQASGLAQPLTCTGWLWGRGTPYMCSGSVWNLPRSTKQSVTCCSTVNRTTLTAHTDWSCGQAGLLAACKQFAQHIAAQHEANQFGLTSNLRPFIPLAGNSMRSCRHSILLPARAARSLAKRCT